MLRSNPSCRQLGLSRREVYPHLAVPDLHREDTRFIGELVECPTALQIEACVVPVAGQDTIVYAPPVQGESHMWTAIIHGVHLAIFKEERERVTADPYRHATGGAHIV
jgi:hypothetical protein